MHGGLRETVRKAIATRDVDAQKAVARILRDAPCTGADLLLLVVLRTAKNAEVRALVYQAMAAVEHERWLDYALKALRANETEVRLAGVEILAEHANLTGLDDLFGQLTWGP